MHPTTGKKVLVEKPKRGREMLTREVPETLIDTMGVISAQKLVNKDEDVRELLMQNRKPKLTSYHEGYVDHQKYLVPDSTLEAMKTLVDFKSNRREGRKYLQEIEPETEKEAYKRYQDKFEQMYKKVHSDEEVEEDDEVEESEVEEESYVEEEIEVEEESDMEGNEEGEEDIPEHKITSEPYSNPIVDNNTEENGGLRFLISGHFKENMKPIFIIQQYEGESPLNTKSNKFMSTIIDSNISIVISGKYYKENILLEIDNKLKSLKVEPTDIVIDERSKVYDKTFSDTFPSGDINVTFSGRFFKNPQTNKYTPVLSIRVDKNKTSWNTNMTVTNDGHLMTQVKENKRLELSKEVGDIEKYDVSQAHETVMYSSQKTPNHLGNNFQTLQVQNVSQQSSGLLENPSPFRKHVNRVENIRSVGKSMGSKTTDKGIKSHPVSKSQEMFEKVPSNNVDTSKSDTFITNKLPRSKTPTRKRVSFLEPFPDPLYKNRSSFDLTQSNTKSCESPNTSEKSTKFSKMRRWFRSLMRN